MMTSAIYGHNLAPAVLADEKGNVVRVEHAASPEWLESLFRPVRRLITSFPAMSDAWSPTGGPGDIGNFPRLATSRILQMINHALILYHLQSFLVILPACLRILHPSADKPREVLTRDKRKLQIYLQLPKDLLYVCLRTPPCPAVGSATNDLEGF